MRKLLYFLLSISVTLCLVIVIVFIILTKDFKYLNRYNYSLNGEVAEIATCFTTDEGSKYCRTATKIFEVDDYWEVRVPRH